MNREQQKMEREFNFEESVQISGVCGGVVYTCTPPHTPVLSPAFVNMALESQPAVPAFYWCRQVVKWELWATGKSPTTSNYLGW